MPAKRKPSYTLHAATGQGRCRIDGHDHYLGAYNSPASREKYDELVAEWFARNGDVSRITLTIDDLAIRFMEFAEKYYRRKDGEPTGSAANFRHALRPLVRLFGSTRIRDFGPVRLKIVRDDMIQTGHCRTNINREVHRIRRVFGWAVENELIPVEVYQALVAVASLKAGRSDAVESARVRPVAEEIVAATLPHLPRIVAEMVKLQLLTACRPGEVSSLRPCDVTFLPDGNWVYRPQHHKSEYRGRERAISIGPEGQAVLRPFLDRDAEAYCFSPAESEADRNAAKRANRKSPMTPSQAARRPKTNRRWPPADRYDKDAYNRAITRACKLAGVQHWAPNQLRHLRGTDLCAKFGIEATSIIMGHAEQRTTRIYVEPDFATASRVMAEVG